MRLHSSPTRRRRTRIRRSRTRLHSVADPDIPDRPRLRPLRPVTSTHLRRRQVSRAELRRRSLASQVTATHLSGVALLDYAPADLVDNRCPRWPRLSQSTRSRRRLPDPEVPVPDSTLEPLTSSFTRQANTEGSVSIGASEYAPSLNENLIFCSLYCDCIVLYNHEKFFLQIQLLSYTCI